MPVQDLFTVSFRIAFSKLFLAFYPMLCALGCFGEGRLAVSEVLLLPVEPFLRRLSNQDLTTLQQARFVTSFQSCRKPAAGQ